MDIKGPERMRFGPFCGACGACGICGTCDVSRLVTVACDCWWDMVCGRLVIAWEKCCEGAGRSCNCLGDMLDLIPWKIFRNRPKDF